MTKEEFTNLLDDILQDADALIEDFEVFKSPIFKTKSNAKVLGSLYMLDRFRELAYSDIDNAYDYFTEKCLFAMSDIINEAHKAIINWLNDNIFGIPRVDD